MSTKKKIILIIFGLLIIVIAGVVYIESTKTCCAPPPFQNQVLDQFSKNQANFEIVYTTSNGSLPPQSYRQNQLIISTNQEGSASAKLRISDTIKVLEEKSIDITNIQLQRLMKTASQIDPKSKDADGCSGGSTKSVKITKDTKVLLEASSYYCDDTSTNKSLEEFATEVERLLLTDTKSQSEKECLEKGGKWGKLGLSPKEECNLPTSDSGEKCTDGSECEGSCIGERAGVTSGKCSKWTIVRGCYPFVSNGKAEGIICAD